VETSPKPAAGARGADAGGAPAVDERDGDALARYLLSFRWPYRHADVERELVAGGLPLWREILRLVPQPDARGRALELGSPPFHITLLLRRFRRYDLTLAGCATDDRAEIAQEMESREYGERHAFSCRAFDVERDRFPFDDASFDLVTCCEVIEHLTENPVHLLAEVHRVLRPGGRLVVSTPNVARAGNIASLLRGRNVYDPYHLGAPLRGSRHSREYTLDELRDLVGGCGFAIEVAEDVDLQPARGLRQRALRALLNRVVAPLTGAHHRAHLFVRARRTDAPFRWHYPADLFDRAQLAFHLAPALARIAVGVDDRGHLGIGWSDVRPGAGGRAARRSAAGGDVYLRLEPGRRAASRVVVEVSDGRGEVEVWHDDGDEPVLLGVAPFAVAGDAWQEIEVRIAQALRPEARLHLRLVAPAGVDLHAAGVRDAP
jgi:SAM-dependent methyltransferase